MNIFQYCRKLIEKSRVQAGYLSFRRIDIFLLIAALAVLIFIAIRQPLKTIEKHNRIDITISSRCGDLFGRDIVNTLIHEFEESNPDLHVRETDSNNADIVFFDDGEYSSLVSDSVLASLAYYEYTGNRAGQWALPLALFMDIFVYNIDILKTAHCDRPPKTRAEFIAAARAVSGINAAASGHKPVYAFALGLSADDPAALRRDFYPWVWANGGEIRAESSLSGAAADVIAFLGQLNHEGLLAPHSFEKTGAHRLGEFANGNIAMMTASARDIAFLQKNAHGVTFDITTVPVITRDKNHLGLSGIYAGMSSACTMPDKAWLFLTFFAGKNNILAEVLGAVPGCYPGVFTGDYIAQNPLYSKAWDIFEAADIVDHEPGQPHEEAVNRLIREKLAEAFR